MEELKIETTEYGVYPTHLLFQVEKIGFNVQVQVGPKAERTIWQTLVPEPTRPIFVVVAREGYKLEDVVPEEPAITVAELNTILNSMIRDMENKLKQVEGEW